MDTLRRSAPLQKRLRRRVGWRAECPQLLPGAPRRWASRLAVVSVAGSAARPQFSWTQTVHLVSWHERLYPFNPANKLAGQKKSRCDTGQKDSQAEKLTVCHCTPVMKARNTTVYQVKCPECVSRNIMHPGWWNICFRLRSLMWACKACAAKCRFDRPSISTRSRCTCSDSLCKANDVC